MFTEDLTPVRQRRGPVLLLFALIAGGAAGAFAIVVKTRGAVVAESGRDAGVIAMFPDTGRPSPHEPVDAALDAADLIVLPEPADAGRRITTLRRRDAGALVAPDAASGRGTVVVQVLTRPEGANLYEGYHYRGPGGTNFEEPLGTRMTITCRQPGYQPGTVEVTFDGHTEAVLCVLQRIKRCIAGLKNPFDDCEPAP